MENKDALIVILIIVVMLMGIYAGNNFLKNLKQDYINQGIQLTINQFIQQGLTCQQIPLTFQNQQNQTQQINFILVECLNQ